ncbi:DUF6578 domain-containing protein [Microbacterium sp. P02]|uniref:DUF6578 domain-containing protein n=1 Tax=Microbacterium sp. P02 TaxID=3366260 RepID=UPI0036705627
MSAITRVWLADGEWQCCGEAFAVGDDIDFGIATRSPHLALADKLGPVLVETVDAIESHHEDDFVDRVRGRVLQVHAVTREVVERRSLRRPGHGAPPTAVMPPAGEEWPLIRHEWGNGVGAWVGSRPSRYVVEIIPIPDTAVLDPVDGVRLPAAEGEEAPPSFAVPAEDPPPERRTRSFMGWLVDIDEH